MIRSSDDTGRARQAHVANLRSELLAPAEAILGYAGMLHDEAARRRLEAMLPDLANLRASARELFDLVDGVLDDGAGHGTSAARAEGQLRHDLRTPLSAIKGYGELLVEDLGRLGGEALRPDLMNLLAEAHRLLAQLDAIVDFYAATRVTAGLVRSIEPVGDGATEAAETGAILVVDDNASNRDLLARRLRRDGHRVAAAGDGRQALSMVEAGDFDLVLLDVMMPAMNGFEVLTRLKADTRLREIPVVMISALDEMDSVIRCIEAGAEDYLPKPFNPALLAARIGACLRRRRWRQDAGARRAGARRATADADLSARAGDRPALAPRESELKRALEAVLDEADARRARNRQLTTRNLARLMAGHGGHRFKQQTLRKIIDRRYPPLFRLGIVNGSGT